MKWVRVTLVTRLTPAIQSCPAGAARATIGVRVKAKIKVTIEAWFLVASFAPSALTALA